MTDFIRQCELQGSVRAKIDSQEDWQQYEARLNGCALQLATDSSVLIADVASPPQRCKPEEHGDHCFSLFDGLRGGTLWIQVDTPELMVSWMRALGVNRIQQEAQEVLQEVNTGGEISIPAVQGASLSGGCIGRVPSILEDGTVGALVIAHDRVAFEAMDSPEDYACATAVKDIHTTEARWRGHDQFAESQFTLVSELTVCELCIQTAGGGSWSCCFEWAPYASLAVALIDATLVASASGSTSTPAGVAEAPRVSNGWTSTCTAAFAKSDAVEEIPTHPECMGEVEVLRHLVRFGSQFPNLDGTPGPTSALIPLDELQGLEQHTNDVILYHPAGVVRLGFSSEQQASECVHAVNESLATLLPLLARLGGGRASIKLMGAGLQSAPLRCSASLQQCLDQHTLLKTGSLYVHEGSGTVYDRYLLRVPGALQIRANHFWLWYDRTDQSRADSWEAVAGQSGSGIVRNHRMRAAAWRGLTPTSRAVAWRGCSESSNGVIGGLLQRKDQYNQLLQTHPAAAGTRILPAQYNRGSGCESPQIRQQWRLGADMCLRAVSYTHLTLPTKRIV
eukprot:TRINITY_DN17254_c0_g1_i2.p1 TRINITY_DN17254_c0_g1~~TRINITY_DN17254_c0_g1_i2.p1  ORF type:complete len:564 (-),score=108.55 TRINITY_DN17254_c0_g1_i2:24-1715(-)